MARYIKANYKVARYLKLENVRNRVTDGNYLLWQADMLAFGRLTELPAIMERIGGLSLKAHEARQEQDGTVVRPLPTATDPQFVVETSTNTDGTESTEAEVAEEPTTNTGETESTETEAAEEPATNTVNTEEG